MSAIAPTQKSISDLVSTLVGKSVTAKPCPPLAPGAAPLMAGVYVDDTNKPVGLFLCDLTLGCSVGAALSMVPPAAVAEAVKTGNVPPNLLDNTREVINIAANLIASACERHVRLRDVAIGKVLPADATALLAKPLLRIDAELAIPGYGTGKLALVVGG